MFKRIVVAYDGSEGADAALRMGIDLAKGEGAELSSVSVEEHLPRYAASISEVEGAREQIDEHFRAVTKRARDAAALAGVELDAVVRRGHPIGAVLDFIGERGADGLVLGSHGHSRTLEHLIGSTSLSLARLAPSSVLIARSASGEGLASVKRILVGLDGSPLGRLALRAAVDLSILCGAGIIGLTVREVSPLGRDDEADSGYARRLGAAVSEQARAAGVAFEHVARSGHAAKEIQELARRERADLIVLGATGLEHPWSGTIGGTASRIASEAACSVLLVRPPQAVLRVADIMALSVSSVTANAPLAEIVELLLRRDVKAVPVVDAERRVIGIVSGGDLLSRGNLGLRLSLKRELDPDDLRQQLAELARSPKTAREVMTRHVHTVDRSTDLATVIRTMVERRIKRLPVVDEHQRLVGLVSRADVLRAIAALPEPRPGAMHEIPVAVRTVADVATTEVPVLAPDTPGEEVLRRVLESPMRRAVVATEEGRVVGIVGDRDLLARSSPQTRPWILRMLTGRAPRSRRAGTRGPAGGLTAADLMAPALFSVRPEDSLTHAIRLMMQHQVKRLVVVDDAGRFRGVVDRREIIRLLAGEGGQ